MKALAKAAHKGSSTTAAARQQSDGATIQLQRKADNDADALRRIISSRSPANSCGPPVNPKAGAKTAQLSTLIQRSGVQAKLTIGRRDDKYEQEADSVSERVMSMPGPQIRPKPT
ncbi:MAG: hypothetical protein OEV42_19700 [Deltaproteobacteria bacterium]|nr:hypothetical protein [Deltaproteobacteria bacterium]